jgi:hypothetical protein
VASLPAALCHAAGTGQRQDSPGGRQPQSTQGRPEDACGQAPAQKSTSNTKPEYIFGHHCQAIALLAGSLCGSIFAIPIVSRIHEGVVFSNRDSRTLLDKMLAVLTTLCIAEPFYFIADAYYAGKTVIRGVLRLGNHLVTRVRSNAVAYRPAAPRSDTPRKKRGRPATYGRKLRLKEVFADTAAMQSIPSPLSGEHATTIRFTTADLFWRPVGVLVRFVFVIHPTRGSIILLSTDTSLPAQDIIRIYGFRFKIEVSFKQALRVLGAYAYHFWMKTAKTLRKQSGNQYLHRASDDFRNAVRRKIAAYHAHIQIGLIAQGLLQCLSLAFPKLVWASYGSWLRTQRPDLCPSELVTAIALKNSFPHFLADSLGAQIFKKFLTTHIDFDRIEGARMVT